MPGTTHPVISDFTKLDFFCLISLSLKTFKSIYFAEDETDSSHLDLKPCAPHLEQNVSCINTRKVAIPLKVSANQKKK